MSEIKFQVLEIFFKFNTQPPVSVFMFLMFYFMLDELIVLRQSDFSSERCSRMIFEGGFFGSMWNIWGSPLHAGYVLTQTWHSNMLYVLSWLRPLQIISVSRPALMHFYMWVGCPFPLFYYETGSF